MLFRKLRCSFLVESTKIENTSFLYKTCDGQTKWSDGQTKWTYHKELSFASNCFIFLKNIAPVYPPLIKSWFVWPTAIIAILVLFVSARTLFDGAFFPVSIFKDICDSPYRKCFGFDTVQFFLSKQYFCLSITTMQNICIPKETTQKQFLLYSFKDTHREKAL